MESSSVCGFGLGWIKIEVLDLIFEEFAVKLRELKLKFIIYTPTLNEIQFNI